MPDCMRCVASGEVRYLHDDESRALRLAVLVVVHLDLRQVKQMAGRNVEFSAANAKEACGSALAAQEGVCTFFTGPPYLRRNENQAAVD